MNKKIISILVVATIAFMCVFAACDKGTYTNPATGTKYQLVTDENGEKILSDDGELLVYVTDENGRRVKDENGEYETAVQGFIGQIEENGVVEDYAYKLTLPDGWRITETEGLFENRLDKKTAEIKILDQSYSDYYDLNKKYYKDVAKLNNYTATWEEENIEFVKGAENVCRVTFMGEKEIKVAYFFENNDNLYNYVYTTSDVKEDTAASAVAFFNNVEFKDFTYYVETTETLPYVTIGSNTTESTK